ncbi:MAG TPA: Tar ligand binding domain-containing protein, partial [Usitatibacter sp.]|nr:Tar ligand binding domain-containing protein [Usitatibacter sp.]
MFSNVTIRTRLVVLLVFVNSMLFAAAGYAWYAIDRLNDQLVHAMQVQEQEDRAADAARRAQLEFKTQVQEWKNMLLRGDDAQLLDRHTAAFEASSVRVNKHLASLNEQARALGLPAGLADKAIAEHAELDRKYHEAFKQFRGNDIASADVVDKAVRGIDRAATDQIDAIVKLVHDHADGIAAGTAASAVNEKRVLIIGLATLA